MVASALFFYCHLNTVVVYFMYCGGDLTRRNAQEQSRAASFVWTHLPQFFTKWCFINPTPPRACSNSPVAGQQSLFFLLVTPLSGLPHLSSIQNGSFKSKLLSQSMVTPAAAGQQYYFSCWLCFCLGLLTSVQFKIYS